MFFKKEICVEDEELGFLKAETSLLETSSVKWKKRIDFMGSDLNLVVSGTRDRLNKAERKIIVNALKDIKFLEKQVLEVIKGLCNKHNVTFDKREEYFMCSRIYVDKADPYISIEDTLNKLTYELELKWY
jgi:hypothetical protein